MEGRRTMYFSKDYLNNKLFCNLPMSFDRTSLPHGAGAEIQENGDVLFRIYAPASISVELKITINRTNVENLVLEKTNNGFFEGLLANDGEFNGPLNVSVYFDGMWLLYPWLPIYWSAGSPFNYVEFPDEIMEFAMVRDVPHGAVSHQIYFSRATGELERCLVYTPPGYMNGSESYPALYLLHGGGENETVWESTGKLSTIMDNLIADKRSVPFIVVMNNGMIRYPDSPAGLNDRCFEDSLIGSCIPFIEKTYRVKGDKWNRAIAGLSMGSYTANDIALFHPDMFAYVAAFTGCMYHGGDKEHTYERPWVGMMKTGNIIKENYRVFFQSATPIEDYIQYVLEDNRICVENGIAEMPGYRFILHSPKTTKWTSWRMGLRDYAKILFREEEAYQDREKLEKYAS